MEERKFDLHWLEEYSTYDPSRQGCNENDPFVILDEDDYIEQEYEMIDDICGSFFREFFQEYQVSKQSLLGRNGRKIDRIDVDILEPVLADDGKEEMKVVGQESYFFDITIGFNAMSRQLRLSNENDEE